MPTPGGPCREKTRGPWGSVDARCAHVADTMVATASDCPCTSAGSAWRSASHARGEKGCDWALSRKRDADPSSVERV